MPSQEHGNRNVGCREQVPTRFESLLAVDLFTSDPLIDVWSANRFESLESAKLGSCSDLWSIDCENTVTEGGRLNRRRKRRGRIGLHCRP